MPQPGRCSRRSNPLAGVGLLVHRPAVALAIIGAVFLAIDRRRGAVRRHGPLRQAAGAHRLVRAGGAGAAAQLFRPGRAAAASSASRSTHPLYHLVPAAVLPWLVILATAATVIASQAIISGAFSMARQAVQLDLLPRLARAADLRARAGTDLRAGRELAGVPRRDRLRGRLRLLGCAGGRLRRRGGRHHGRHHDPRRVRRGDAVELAEVAGGGAVRPAAAHRLRVRRRQHDQGAHGGLDSADARRAAVSASSRPGAAGGSSCARRSPSWRCRAASCRSWSRACIACPGPGCSSPATRSSCPRR